MFNSASFGRPGLTPRFTLDVSFGLVDAHGTPVHRLQFNRRLHESLDQNPDTFGHSGVKSSPNFKCPLCADTCELV